MKTMITALLVTFALAGCATFQGNESVDTEQLLGAAGFKMKLADTPAKLAHLKTLTQNKLVAHSKDGEAVFVYADASTCQCMYVGNQKVYQEYQRLAVKKKLLKIIVWLLR